MAIVKKISELTPKGSALSNTDLLVVGVDNGTDYDLKSVTGAQLLGNVISQTITDGDTTHSPSSNVVFDSLALKVDKVTGSRLITSGEATILGNTSGTNTGDQDLSNYATNSTVVKLTGDQTIAGEKTFNSNTTHEQGLRIKNGTSSNTIGYTGIGANENQLIIGISGATQNLTFPNIASYNYTFPSATGTLSLTSDLTSKVDSNTAITGATKTKITYDSKGLVTSGSDATTSDISDSSNKRYVTDANLTTIGNTSGTNTGDQTISDATITTTDITTNNFTTSKHGFVPKGTNVGNYLKDDGTWSTISAGGLTYFTEAQNTTAPNATVPVDSLTAVSSAANADFAILPKGTGAFIVGHIPDNTYINGGKRGAYAIDIQPATLGASTNIASGISAIAIGLSNQSNGNYSTSIGAGGISSGNSSLWLGSNSGGSGVSSGDNSVAIQLQSRATNTNSFAIQNGAATGVNAFAGSFSTASGVNSVAMGGASSYTAQATAAHSIAIGDSCTSDARSSVAFGAWTSTKGVAQRLSLGSFQVIGEFLRGHAQLSLSSSVAITTTNTVTELVAYGGTAINLVLQNNEAIRVKGSIIGKQTASTNVACYDFDCVIVRGTTAASTILPLSNVNLVLDTITLGTIPTLTADTTNGGLSVKSGAKTTTTIKWSCRIDSTEVILA